MGEGASTKLFDSASGALVADGSLAVPVAADTTTVIFTGATAGMAYQAQVAAHSTLGWGCYSECSKTLLNPGRRSLMPPAVADAFGIATYQAQALVQSAGGWGALEPASLLFMPPARLNDGASAHVHAAT